MPPIFNRRSWQNSGKVGKPFEAEGWPGMEHDRAIGSDGHFSPKGSEGQPKTFQCCTERRRFNWLSKTFKVKLQPAFDMAFKEIKRFCTIA